MATKAANIISRADLTNYAFGISQDLKALMDLINFLAPVVPTGGTTGLYNKFEDTQAFLAYSNAVARRAIGGKASIIEFLSTTANYNAKPYGFRISIDQFERDQVANSGQAMQLMEQGKTRTLIINSMVAFVADVVTKIKAAVTATAGKGDWQSANVDPIVEINDLIESIWNATGIVPNSVAIDFAAWCRLRNNALVKKYFPGAPVMSINTNMIQGLLVNPNAEIKVVDLSQLNGGGLGNASATRKGLLGGSVLAYYSSKTATQYDPSFFKTFAPAATLFTQIGQYREEPNLDWYENDWTCDPVVVAANLCGRIDVQAKV